MGAVETLLRGFGYVRDDARQERREPTFAGSPSASRARNSSLEDPNVPIDGAQLASLLGGGPTSAGVAVGERSAMRSTAVFACVALVAGVVASMPLNVCQRTPKGPDLATSNRMFSLLNQTPNADIALTSFNWIELILTHLQLAGNHYSAIEFDGAGRVIGFVPIMPWQVQVMAAREGMGFRRRYRITLSDGNVYELDQDEVLHIAGLGYDGLKGLSPIHLAGRQTIGANIAMEETAARILANGARNSGIVTQGAGKQLSLAALGELKAEFRQLYQGSHNAGEVVFLDNGMSFAGVQMSLKDAELLESRKFSVVDICRIFGVPPFLIGETADMTAWGSGIEQIMNGFLMLGLNRWLRRIEAELNLKLFNGTDFYAQFDREALMAMNLPSLGDYFAKMSGAGYAINEIREKLGKKHVEGGDEPLVPMTYQPLSRAMTAQVVPTPPAAAAA